MVKLLVVRLPLVEGMDATRLDEDGGRHTGKLKLSGVSLLRDGLRVSGYLSCERGGGYADFENALVEEDPTALMSPQQRWAHWRFELSQLTSQSSRQGKDREALLAQAGEVLLRLIGHGEIERLYRTAVTPYEHGPLRFVGVPSMPKDRAIAFSHGAIQTGPSGELVIDPAKIASASIMPAGSVDAHGNAYTPEVAEQIGQQVADAISANAIRTIREAVADVAEPACTQELTPAPEPPTTPGD